MWEGRYMVIALGCEGNKLTKTRGNVVWVSMVPSDGITLEGIVSPR